MDKTIRRYTDFDEMKAGEYRYWQSRPVHSSAGLGVLAPFGLRLDVLPCVAWMA